MTPSPSELLLALALFTSNAHGSDDCTSDGHDVLASINARGTLRVAHTDDYRPFSFDGTGIDVDLAKRLAQELGVSLQWIDTTWSTLIDDLRADRYDIAMSGVSVTSERSAAGCFTTPYFRTGKTVLKRCASHRSFDTLEQIDDPSVRVIVNPGGTNERFVRERLKNAHVVPHDDNRTIFRALAAGEADLMITDAIEARLEAQANPVLCVDEPPPMFENVSKAYLIPKDPHWQTRLDAWLARLKSSGELDALQRRYLDAPSNAAPQQ